MKTPSVFFIQTNQTSKLTIVYTYCWKVHEVPDKLRHFTAGKQKKFSRVTELFFPSVTRRYFQKADRLPFLLAERLSVDCISPRQAELSSSWLKQSYVLGKVPFAALSSFRKERGRFARVKLTSLKACNRKIPTIIVRKPLKVPIMSSAPMCCHSLNRMAEQVKTDVVKIT